MTFPERILYLLSDLLYLLMYHVAGYRKEVVFDNLGKAFPEYDNAEIRRIAKKFYRHLCDLFLESAVSHFYSESKALKKITYINPELLNELHGTGKQVMAVLGHYGNWEYLSTLGLAIDYPVVAIYKPLRNKHFDRIAQRNRNSFGVITVPMDKIARQLIDYKRRKEPVLTLFLADQRPQFNQIQYWTKFLGLDTPLYLGTEKLARKLDAAVVFIKIRKKSRGRYEVEFELICEEPGKLEPYAITESHVRILENLIREDPAYWLWSHKRWKHSYERFIAEKGDYGHGPENLK
ncbi:MAG: lysophospholipid acyltransferase family protein [Bacteroidetes bacterium]|nr:lysophospholipid acyltransferase family protein [Bacteroidota bacterium]